MINKAFSCVPFLIYTENDHPECIDITKKACRSYTKCLRLDQTPEVEVSGNSLILTPPPTPPRIRGGEIAKPCFLAAGVGAGCSDVV